MHPERPHKNPSPTAVALKANPPGRKNLTPPASNALAVKDRRRNHKSPAPPASRDLADKERCRDYKTSAPSASRNYRVLERFSRSDVDAPGGDRPSYVAQTWVSRAYKAIQGLPGAEHPLVRLMYIRRTLSLWDLANIMFGRMHALPGGSI